MSSPATKPGWKCSECGAEVRRLSSARCWLCGGEIRRAEQEEAVAAIVLDKPPYDRHAAYQFSISTLLLLMTLTAVLGGVAAMAPGLGIVLALFTVPALAHAAVVVGRKKTRGEKVDAVERVGIFAQSLGLTIAIVVGLVVALIVALFAICVVAIGIGNL